MSPPVRLRPVDKMEMRLMREAGAKVKDCAGYFGVSIPTAMRALAELRKRLGPEKFTGTQAHRAKQRARAHLFVSNASEEPNNPTSE